MRDPEVILITLLLLAAVGAGVQAWRLPQGTAKALWSFVGSCLFGAMFCFAGIWNLVGIHTARRISVTGAIANLDQEGGRRSADFSVIPVSGPPVKVHCEYTGARLRNGETVTVDELSFHSTLLKLQVLDGNNSGWRLEEGDGTATSVTVLVLGAALIFAARAHRISHPEG